MPTPNPKQTSGQAFAALDRLLDQAIAGPKYLSQPEIAATIVQAIAENQSILNHYETHAYVVMPNHVHLLITLKVPLPKVTQSLKGITAKRANAILNRTGHPFWQSETYDHAVRNSEEFTRIHRYIENNPVRAGLVSDPTHFKWSSAVSRVELSLL